MAVRQRRNSTRILNLGSQVSGESGQSILELLFLLPMLAGLIVILVRINTAIQISIVNQQYSRSMIFFSNMNSPDYPSRSLLKRAVAANSLVNQMTFGISDKPIGQNDNDFEASNQPEASTQYVARKPRQGSEEPGDDITQRGKVRIRNTVTLCTPTVALRVSKNKMVPNVDEAGYRLDESTQFDFCGGTLSYE